MRAINVQLNWWPNLDNAIANRAIRTFLTRKNALECSHAFGWGDRVLRLSRRFEQVWIIGAVDFQPDETAGVVRDVLRVPALRYETSDNGISYQPVMEFRLVRTAEGQVPQIRAPGLAAPPHRNQYSTMEGAQSLAGGALDE